MELYDVMMTTPATRAFTDEAVPDEVVHRILDHARFAPSGGNRQAWHVVVVKDPGVRRRIRDLYALSWREYMAHVDAGLVPFAPGDDGVWKGPAIDLQDARERAQPDDFADRLEAVPVMLVLFVRLSALACIDNGMGRQSIVGGGSIYPFGQNILLAARNEGLGGVLTSVLARQEPALKEMLGVPPGHGVAGLIAIGRPERTLTRLRRRPVESFTTVDRFDGATFAL